MHSFKDSSEAIRIVEYNEKLKKYDFDAKAFAKIAASEEIKDLPVAVVSIIGDYRKGKSFLLNYFLRYLKLYDQENWLGDPNEPLQGFAWKQGAERCTTGIALWPEPLIVTRADGTKIAVILMDTQGLDGDSKDIFAISSLLSSIQVYNKSNNIQSNDIRRLSQLIRHLQEKQNDMNFAVEKLDNLWFLVRDWGFDCDYPFGADGRRQFLNFKRRAQSEKFQQHWETIDACYSQVDCFLMPHPGLDAINNPGFRGQRRYLDTEFVIFLRKLVLNLLSPENIKIKTNGDEPMKFFEFVEFFEKVEAAFSGNNFIYGNEPQLAIHYISQSIEAARSADEQFCARLEIFADNNPNDIEQLISKLEKAYWEAISFYLEKTQSIDSEIMLDSLEELRNSLECHSKKFQQRIIKRQTERKIAYQIAWQLPSNDSSTSAEKSSFIDLILSAAKYITPNLLLRLINAYFNRKTKEE